jgi:hypothetical protein
VLSTRQGKSSIMSTLSEFHLPLPMTEAQYYIGQRYLKAQETFKDGVKIVRIDSYEDIPLMSEERFSEGIFSTRLLPAKKVPAIIAGSNGLELEEQTWNATQFVKTVIRPVGRFKDYLTIKMFFHLLDGDFTNEDNNIFELVPERLSERKLETLDIAEDLEDTKYLFDELPIQQGWMESAETMMTVHCLMHIDCSGTPAFFRGIVFNFIYNFTRTRLIKSHRKMLVTMNKWKDMTEDQLCQIEKEALIAGMNDEDENIDTISFLTN